MKLIRLEKQGRMKYPNLGKSRRFLNSSCSENARSFAEWKPPIVSENLVLLVSDNFYVDDLFNRLQNLFYPKIISYKKMLFFDFTFDKAYIDRLTQCSDKLELQKSLNQVNLHKILKATKAEEFHQIQELHRALLFFWELLYSSILTFELDDCGIKFYAKSETGIQADNSRCRNVFSLQSLLEELEDYDFCSKIEFLLAFSDFLCPQILHIQKHQFLEFLYRQDLYLQYQQSSNITNIELAMNLFEIDFEDKQKCEEFCFFLSLIWNLGFKKRGLGIRTKIAIDEDKMTVAQISVGLPSPKEDRDLRRI